MSIIFAPLDDPAREHGLTLHKVGRVRRGHTPPTPMLQVSGSDDEDALGGEVEERRVRGLGCMQALRQGLEEARTI